MKIIIPLISLFASGLMFNVQGQQIMAEFSSSFDAAISGRNNSTGPGVFGFSDSGSGILGESKWETGVRGYSEYDLGGHFSGGLYDVILGNGTIGTFNSSSISMFSGGDISLQLDKNDDDFAFFRIKDGNDQTILELKENGAFSVMGYQLYPPLPFTSGENKSLTIQSQNEIMNKQQYEINDLKHRVDKLEKLLMAQVSKERVQEDKQ